MIYDKSYGRPRYNHGISDGISDFHFFKYQFFKEIQRPVNDSETENNTIYCEEKESNNNSSANVKFCCNLLAHAK